MQTEGLARAGETHLDRFITEVRTRHAESWLMVLWAIWLMKEILSDRVAPILLERRCAHQQETTPSSHVGRRLTG